MTFFPHSLSKAQRTIKVYAAQHQSRGKSCWKLFNLETHEFEAGPFATMYELLEWIGIKGVYFTYKLYPNPRRNDGKDKE